MRDYLMAIGGILMVGGGWLHVIAAIIWCIGGFL